MQVCIFIRYVAYIRIGIGAEAQRHGHIVRGMGTGAAYAQRQRGHEGRRSGIELYIRIKQNTRAAPIFLASHSSSLG